MKKFALILSFLCLPALCAIPAVAGEIDTYPGWNGSDTITSFGYPNTSTYGEVFTAPSTTDVTSINFYLDEPTGFEFNVFVAPWDGTEIDGAILYTSSLITTSALQGGTLAPYSLSGLDVPITAGGEYVIGETIDLDGSYVNDESFSGDIGSLGGDILAGGTSTDYFVWSNDTGNFSALTSNWNNAGCAGSSCGNAAFNVGYSGGSAVPEPSSLLLLGSGLVGLAGMIRRRVKA